MVERDSVMHEHSADCEQARQIVESDRAEYLAKWADYCRECNGWGRQTTLDYDGVYRFDWKTCCCRQRGICPRCGTTDAFWPELCLPTHTESVSVAYCKACAWKGGPGIRPQYSCIYRCLENKER